MKRKTNEIYFFSSSSTNSPRKSSKDCISLRRNLLDDTEEVASSGDIARSSSGQLSFIPNMTGTFEYYCEYHPDTMSFFIIINRFGTNNSISGYVLNSRSVKLLQQIGKTFSYVVKK